MNIKKQIFLVDINTSTLFHNIWQIREACVVLSQPQKIYTHVVKCLYVPQMFLKALECELEMKYIILHNEKEVEKTHDLCKLFEKLPNELKKECILICDDGGHFYNYLQKYKNTFEDFRYENNFKGNGSFEAWFLFCLSNILFNYVESENEKNI